jgi:predicted HD phosphohydrolase
MSDDTQARARFHAMTDGTPEDWAKIYTAGQPFNSELPNRVLAHLQLLGGDYGGFAVDRLTHSLQSATLAYRDGMDEEYVVCALLHDVGDTLGSFNHSEVAAAILKPFVSEANHWMVEHHGIFQGYYFFHYVGLDRNMRDQFRGHAHFERTAMFCARHDQNAFDPAYDTMPLSAFAPMVHRVMARPKTSIYLKEKQAAAE